MTRHEIYNLYRNLKLKCSPTPSRHPHWKFYGARGVRFHFSSCDEFIKCIGPAPSPKHTLQRWPDTTAHFESGNLRWMPPFKSRQKPAKKISHETRPTPALPPLTPAFW
jgi:hypothetical protein